VSSRLCGEKGLTPKTQGREIAQSFPENRLSLAFAQSFVNPYHDNRLFLHTATLQHLLKNKRREMTDDGWQLIYSDNCHLPSTI
jgi:hypothetical protein